MVDQVSYGRPGVLTVAFMQAGVCWDAKWRWRVLHRDGDEVWIRTHHGWDAWIGGIVRHTLHGRASANQRQVMVVVVSHVDWDRGVFLPDIAVRVLVAFLKDLIHFVPASLRRVIASLR